LSNQRQGYILDAMPNLLKKQKVTTDSFTETEKIYVKTVDTSNDWRLELDF
jgi:predicted kinase